MSSSITIRTLDVDGACNCRDLGGYPTAYGRIATRRLVRGAHLSFVNPPGLRALAQLPVATLIDLRGTAERSQHPNHPLDNCQTLHIDVLEGVLDSGNASPRELVRRSDNHAVSAMLPGIYRAFVADERCRLAWKRLFSGLLTAPQGGVYFHCTAGKDRTGFATALILLALGANYDTIMEDYLYSNVAREQENQQLLAEFCAAMPDKDPRVIRGLLEVRPEYLNTAFGEVDKMFGGVESFFKAIGLTPELRERLAGRLIQ
ncbi:protein-tyrosine-phosphatase [Salmonella enterica subsp. enterica serovar Choleraesuis]|nr:protein-tyrosine-phosphatase [Salmonella enterica subsp. enterica serovar Choleraesuis]